jgi:hypothetical protein
MIKQDCKYSQSQINFLERMAQKYIWWQTVDESIQLPDRIIAQVMNIGLFEDWNDLYTNFNSHELIYILQHAECGWFNNRSWYFWHNSLFGDTLDSVPPLPSRF